MMFDINEEHYNCTNCKHYYYYYCSNNTGDDDCKMDGTDNRLEIKINKKSHDTECNVNFIKTNDKADRVLARDTVVICNINRKVFYSFNFLNLLTLSKSMYI